MHRSRIIQGAIALFLLYLPGCTSTPVPTGPPQPIDQGVVKAIDAAMGHPTKTPDAASSSSGFCSHCTTGELCCAQTKTCVADPKTDIMNCGGCGVACKAPSADNCNNGACACGMGPVCTINQVCCAMGAASQCVDVMNDPNNCGGCGTMCQAGEMCVNGNCTSCPTGMCSCGSSSDCPAGVMCCSGQCVNTNSNQMNCGICGMACPSGQTCINGACCTMCPGGGCTDLQNDSMNCGKCGNACPSGDTCSSGQCMMGTGLPGFGDGGTGIPCIPGLPIPGCTGGSDGGGGIPCLFPGFPPGCGASMPDAAPPPPPPDAAMMIIDAHRLDAAKPDGVKPDGAKLDGTKSADTAKPDAPAKMVEASQPDKAAIDARRLHLPDMSKSD